MRLLLLFVLLSAVLLGTDSGAPPTFQAELTKLIQQVNDAWSAMGTARFGPSERENASIAFRRSLRVSSAMQAGDIISESNVRSMRPAGGLLPVHFKDLIGKRVSEDLEIGAAVTWEVVEP